MMIKERCFWGLSIMRRNVVVAISKGSSSRKYFWCFANAIKFFHGAEKPEASYSNLPDATFKDLRRKPPVTCTLFSWHNTLQFSLTRDIHEELGIDE
ncbi:hypothetical protein NC652_005817 [Populus alba x Populus x berolinensis]|nr:hypothetical protein NC652_005817 [Populus alba x Populus x berolinensis]